MFWPDGYYLKAAKNVNWILKIIKADDRTENAAIAPIHIFLRDLSNEDIIFWIHFWLSHPLLMKE